ncbi:GMC family oxidoreductase [Bradyrhizobium guangzhouense]|nr:GMC family oxidoreductase [Bradyrhizobium guangzhouense]
MGHISGKIADIVFNAPESAEAFDFFLEKGAFARRRFTFDAATLRQRKLLNIAFWVDNPPFHDPAHRSSILSAVWLALATPFLGRRLLAEAVRLAHVGPPPFRVTQHIGNIVRSPFSLFVSLIQIVKDRFFAKPRKPGFLIKNAGGKYALHYHAEHIPSPSSRVTLSEETDPLGVPKLSVDLRFSDRDADSVVRAHELLDQFLRKSQLGYLEYRFPKDGRLSGVLSQACDGFHQIGTTRMSSSPDAGTVNSDCKVHGIDNLYILSSSVFPSSGQANPTFLVVALAHRLASHLASSVSSSKGI